VVELEHHWIRFAAIDTGVPPEELKEKGGALLHSRALALSFSRNVVRSVSAVVRLPIFAPARPTKVVALTLSLSAPGEVVKRFR